LIFFPRASSLIPSGWGGSFERARTEFDKRFLNDGRTWGTGHPSGWDRNTEQKRGYNHNRIHGLP
jgi:hypothetical protein